MIFIYTVEVWNRKSHRYDIVHEGGNKERALIQSKKSYIDRGGRNLVRVKEQAIAETIIYRNDECY